jgi:hypothetical protein
MDRHDFDGPEPYPPNLRTGSESVACPELDCGKVFNNYETLCIEIFPSGVLHIFNAFFAACLITFCEQKRLLRDEVSGGRCS